MLRWQITLRATSLINQALQKMITKRRHILMKQSFQRTRTIAEKLPHQNGTSLYQHKAHVRFFHPFSTVGLLMIPYLFPHLQLKGPAFSLPFPFHDPPHPHLSSSPPPYLNKTLSKKQRHVISSLLLLLSLLLLPYIASLPKEEPISIHIITSFHGFLTLAISTRYLFHLILQIPPPFSQPADFLLPKEGLFPHHREIRLYCVGGGRHGRG